jgi:putative PIN family toxin of toxin-antitoxin system
MTLVGTGRFEIYVSVPLVLEYEEVLRRQRLQLGLSQERVTALVDAICAVAKHQKIYFLWRPFLRDEKDNFVLEVAVAARCDVIITYNKKDFRRVEQQFGIQVLDAKAFLQKIGELP